jgi:hypothetical protein
VTAAIDAVGFSGPPPEWTLPTEDSLDLAGVATLSHAGLRERSRVGCRLPC